MLVIVTDDVAKVHYCTLLAELTTNTKCEHPENSGLSRVTRTPTVHHTVRNAHTAGFVGSVYPAQCGGGCQVRDGGEAVLERVGRTTSGHLGGTPQHRQVLPRTEQRARRLLLAGRVQQGILVHAEPQRQQIAETRQLTTDC